MLYGTESHDQRVMRLAQKMVKAGFLSMLIELWAQISFEDVIITAVFSGLREIWGHFPPKRDDHPTFFTHSEGTRRLRCSCTFGTDGTHKLRYSCTLVPAVHGAPWYRPLARTSGTGTGAPRLPARWYTVRTRTVCAVGGGAYVRRRKRAIYGNSS